MRMKYAPLIGDIPYVINRLDDETGILRENYIISIS